jgi:capsular exopolysaccharide synthesis family protein
MTTLPQTNPVRMPRPAGAMPAQLVGPNGSANGHSGGPGPNQGMTANDVWRVIRGNIWLIIAFLFASAVGGYALNDYLVRYHSRYTAHGHVLIKPPISYDPISRTDVTEGDFPGVPMVQRTQALLIKSDSLFTRVLQNQGSPIQNTGWYHSFDVPVKDSTGAISHVFDATAAKESLDESFAATPVDGSVLIDVSMTYSNPRDARDIVQAIVDEHLLSERQSLQDKMSDKEENLTIRRDAEQAKVNQLQDTLDQKAVDLGVNSGVSPDAIRFDSHEVEIQTLTDGVLKIDSDLTAANTQYAAVQKALAAGEEPEGIDETVRGDFYVQKYQSQVDDLDTQIRSLSGQAISDKAKIEELTSNREVCQAKLDDAMAHARVDARNALVNHLQAAIATDQQELDSKNKKIKQLHDDVNRLSDARSQYLSLSQELARERDELSRTKADIDALTSQLQQGATGVEWADKPTIPDAPSFPKLMSTMLACILGGLAMSVGLAFLREMTDTTVRSPRDISRVGNLTLLGMIPHEDDDPQSVGVPLPMIIYQAPTSIMAEGFRQVRTRLQHAASLDTTRSIMVTSSSPGDGKSLVASNLAAGLALNGRRILLVDANFRKPVQDKNFGVDNAVGFSDVLGSLDRFDSAVRKTPVPNLDLMPAGPRPSNPTEMLESQMLLDFIERTLEEYDHVIFDTGPMLLVSETAALAPRVDGVVTVVRARTNTRGLLQRMRDNLRQLKAEHLGVVLNAVRSQGGGYYGRNIKTYYEYQNQSVSAN